MPVTTNHGVNIPTVGGDADEWGTENNDAHQAWDDILSGPQATVLGRVAASDGPYVSLTATQLTTIPNAVVGDSGAGGVKGLVPAPGTGDAAARKFLMASGAWVADEVKAWAILDGVTAATVAGRNLSATKGATGEYLITFGTALASVNYAVFLSGQYAGTYAARVIGAGKTTAGFTVQVNSSTSGSAADATELYVEVRAV